MNSGQLCSHENKTVLNRDQRTKTGCSRIRTKKNFDTWDRTGPEPRTIPKPGTGPGPTKVWKSWTGRFPDQAVRGSLALIEEPLKDLERKYDREYRIDNQSNIQINLPALWSWLWIPGSSKHSKIVRSFLKMRLLL